MLRILFLISLFSIIATSSSAQTSPTYDLNFLRAKFMSKKHSRDVLAVFQVISKDDNNFPPVLSMKLTYSVGTDGEEQSFDIQRSNARIRITILGKNIEEKDSNIYNFIKDMLVKTDRKYLILAFYVDGVSKSEFDQMTMTYGLWEKNNMDLRIEKKFQFTVED